MRPVPIAAYAFNEGAGTTAGDASGNGRTGALTNATWTAAGKYGGALSFNGSSSRVTVADAAALHLSTAMTLEAWVKPSAAGSADWQAIIYKAYDAHFLATLPGAASVPTAGGTVAGGLVQVTSPSGLPANTWTHVATTYDGATLRLFVNGAQVASQPATGRLDDSSSPVEIGGSAIDGGPFAGLIDDVRIYNTALTAAQIQSDMTTPIASAAPAAVAPATSDATSAGVGASVTDPPVATTAPAARAAADGAQPPLRLLTWNVNGGHNRAGAANVDAQVALMVSSGAQVIALQGVTISTAADLSSLYQWKLEAATQPAVERAVDPRAARPGAGAPGRQPVADPAADRGCGDDGVRQRADESDPAGCQARRRLDCGRGQRRHRAHRDHAAGGRRHAAGRATDAAGRLDGDRPDAAPDRRRFPAAADRRGVWPAGERLQRRVDGDRQAGARADADRARRRRPAGSTTGSPSCNDPAHHAQQHLGHRDVAQHPSRGRHRRHRAVRPTL